MTIDSTIGRKLQDHYLLIGVAIVFVALLVRNCGIYPVVFADEYNYSKFSRLLPLADSAVPDYIYLAIYRATNFCGDGFLACARILNALFFVAATPFLYLTARRLCTRGMASAVALLAILAPMNTYTAYFMPESLYFLSFWLLTWFLLRLDSSAIPKAWALAGVLLGLTALVKPHALLFLPAIVAYALYVSRGKEDAWVLRAFRNAGVLVVCAFLTKLLIGYLIAGKAGLTILGPSYTSMASSAASQLQRYLDLLASSAENAKGHALAICLMFGVPIAVATVASCSSAFSKAEKQSDQKISFYALAILVNLVVVVALFTASVTNAGPYESVARLHMRYYNFAFPLLLMAAVSRLSLESITTSLRWRAVAALPIGLAIVYAICTRLAPFTPSFVDCPELCGFTYNSTVFYLLGGISLFALVLWVYSTQAGAKMFVYLLVPLALVFSTVYMNHVLGWRLVPDAYDKAGICTRQYLSKEELSNVVVVGSDLAGLYRALFQLDNPQATVTAIPQGGDCDSAKLPAGKEWVLVVGNHSLPSNTLLTLPMNGFTLAHLGGTITLEFKNSAWPGVISSAQGLYPAEPWGAWSSGKAVTLEWVLPLPNKFSVHLVAHAFGPNVGKEFVAHVGDNAVRFKLGGTLPEERVLNFSNPKRSRTIKIDIPSPTSPKKLKLGDDERTLGIGLTKLRITPM